MGRPYGPKKVAQVQLGFNKWDVLLIEQRALLLEHAIKVFDEMCKSLPFKVSRTYDCHHFGPRFDLKFKFTLNNAEEPTFRKISAQTDALKEFITCVCNDTAVNKYILGVAPQTGPAPQKIPQ
jgi:hypothetical protein